MSVEMEESVASRARPSRNIANEAKTESTLSELWKGAKG